MRRMQGRKSLPSLTLPDIWPQTSMWQRCVNMLLSLFHLTRAGRKLQAHGSPTMQVHVHSLALGLVAVEHGAGQSCRPFPSATAMRLAHQNKGAGQAICQSPRNEMI